MKRSEVERVALECFKESLITAASEDWLLSEWAAMSEFDRQRWHGVAKYVLREVRRARGQTVGWTVVLGQEGDDADLLYDFTMTKDTAEDCMVGYPQYRLARVVVDGPRRRKR